MMRFLQQLKCTLSKYMDFCGLTVLNMLICSSYMWSQFCKKYKKSQMEPPVEGDDQTAAGIVSANMYLFKSYPLFNFAKVIWPYSNIFPPSF